VTRNANMAALQAGYLFPEARPSTSPAAVPLSRVCLCGVRAVQCADSRWLLHTLLCVQIAKRRRAHQEKNPGVRIISLGIGDTTEPIPAPIASAMEKARTTQSHSPAPRLRDADSSRVLTPHPQAAAGLGTLSGYSGYGAEQGQTTLREALATTFYPVCRFVGPPLYARMAPAAD
jgi:hypothetical protein